MDEDEALARAKAAARALAPLIATYRAALIEAGLSPEQTTPLLVDFQRLFVTRRGSLVPDEEQCEGLRALLSATPPHVVARALELLVLRGLVPVSTVEAVVRQVARDCRLES